MIPKKLPKLPKAMFNTPCVIKVGNGAISEDGEPLHDIEIHDKCNLLLKSQQVMNKEKQLVRISGKLILSYDIAPGEEITQGTVIVSGNTYKIYSCTRPLNPDGTIHHTEMELM